MQKRYPTTFRRTQHQSSQKDQLLATAAVKAGSWLIYRGIANAAAHDAQADCIDAWLNPNLPQPLPRFDLWQRFNNLASKKADEFWSTILVLMIEDLRQ